MVRKIAAVEAKGGFLGALQNLLGISVVDNWFDARSFANLADAIASIGLNEATLIISQVTGIGQPNLEVPSNITLQFLPGGSLNVLAGETVILHSEIQAGLQKIFDGVGYIKLGTKNSEVYPQWWGASGDGSTNDRAAIQSAVDALDTPGLKSGTLMFPHGEYLVDGGICIPVSIRGLKIKGAARGDLVQIKATWLIQAGSAPLFTTVGTGSFVFLTIEDVSFRQNSSATGHILNPVHSTSFLDIHRVYFSLSNPDSSFLKISEDSIAHLKVRDLRGCMSAAGATVPAIEIDAHAFNMFALNFEDIMINSSADATAPIFKLDGGNAANASIKFENITLEVPGGGGIELRSIQRAVLENVFSGDVKQPTAPTILIRKSSSDALGSRDIILIGCTLIVGTEANPDVKVLSKKEDPGTHFSLGPVIVGSRIGYLESQDVAPVILDSRGTIINLVGTTTPLWLPRSGRIQGVRGISGTAIESRNLRGSLEVSGTDTSKEHTFTPSPEDDDQYFLTVTPVSHTINANIAATRVTKVDKTATYFTVHVEGAPGMGESVTFDWHLMR